MMLGGTETKTIRCGCGADFECLAWIADMVRDPATGPPCPACTERTRVQEEAERPAREALERRRSLDEAVERELPEMYRWCSFDALSALSAVERQRRVKDPSGIPQAKGALDSSRIVLMGAAGLGKTVLASCILRAWSEKGAVVFVDGYQLAVARAQSHLGDEAPMVTRALRARGLVIDDLLAKPGTAIHDATSDVIFERHQRMRRTVVTTGFNLEQIQARLGDGIARRIFEGAAVINLKPSA